MPTLTAYSGMDRLTLERHAWDLQVKNDALGHVLRDVEAALDQAIRDVALARCVLLDTSTPEDDA